MLDQIYCWHQDILMRVLFTYSKEYSGSQKYIQETEKTWAINHEQTVKGEKGFLFSYSEEIWLLSYKLSFT